MNIHKTQKNKKKFYMMSMFQKIPGWLIGVFITIVIIFLLGKQFIPDLGKEDESVLFSEFITIEEMQVIKTNEIYTVNAKVTIPNMSKYIFEFASNDVFGKNEKWEDIERKIATEFLKFLKKQTEIETEIYELELDLFPYIEDYKISLEYWKTQGETESSNTGFSEEQIQDILRKEAIRRNLQELWKNKETVQ